MPLLGTSKLIGEHDHQEALLFLALWHGVAGGHRIGICATFEFEGTHVLQLAYDSGNQVTVNTGGVCTEGALEVYL